MTNSSNNTLKTFLKNSLIQEKVRITLPKRNTWRSLTIVYEKVVDNFTGTKERNKNVIPLNVTDKKFPIWLKQIGQLKIFIDILIFSTMRKVMIVTKNTE